jgi:acetolactate synthase-1/2/3 large subunit/5-guanidino-2-oxopentanoate decarboxylase
VIAKNPDFMSLAKAYGANAVAPATFAELRQAVTEAFAADGPTVIYLTPAIRA